MNPVIKGVLQTVNPKGGTNLTESCVVIIIVATVAYCSIKSIVLPPFFEVAFGTVLGWLFKRNSGKDDE